MQPEVLLIEPMMPEIEDRLEQAYVVHRFYDEASSDLIRSALPNIGAVATGGGTGLSNEWIERLPSLGIVAINGVGTDKVDLAFARSKGVHVSTTPGVLTEDVADMGLALVLSTLRLVPQGDRFVREGRWSRKPFPMGRSLKGCKVGIVGLGAIGRAFGRRAEACGMIVGYWNRSAIQAHGWVSHESVADLARASDILVVCVASNAETKNLIDANVLAALGNSGILINVARGSVVEEDALIAALQDRTIASAGLDVFVNEPNIRSAFFDLPNVVLMPHQGSATYETRLAMGELVIANIDAYFSDRSPPTVVN